MSANSNPAGSRPRSGSARRTASFWDRVSEGLELTQLWRQFRSEARATYGMYSKDVDWDAIDQQKGPFRMLAIAKAFFLAMLMKLSPTRRILLLASIVFFLLGKFRVTFGGAQAAIDFTGLGFVMLFFVLALELSDRVIMKRDLEIAREIQRWLVLEAPPAIPGYEIAFATRPANTVAGDYYDVVKRDSGDHAAADRWLLVVADVAGKSVPAALLMATFQASLQTLSAAAKSLPELIDGVNGYASAHSLGGLRFTTAFIAELDPVSRRITYVNAGHNSPILRRAAGAHERLDVGGMPFGIDASARFEIGTAQLNAGDQLVIFTDGVVEAVNEKGEEYSDMRLVQLASQMPLEPAGTTLQRIMLSVDVFTGTAPQHDDTTCFVLRVL